MRGILADQPALNYLDLVLRSRIAKARAAAEGEERDLGASAVEWVVITMIVLVIVVAAGIVINTAIKGKTGKISTCINNAGNGTTQCAP